MMRQMRDQMKLIMIVTSVAFVGLMVFGWGMDISGRSQNGTPGVLGKVNGDPIGYQEFNVTYRSLYEQAQQARKEPMTPAETRQVEDAAWNQLVMDKLIAQELKKRGIQVTDEEIRQAAKYSPPPELARNAIFQTNGQFDLAKYQQFLSSQAVDNTLLLQLEAYYRDVIPKSKLFYQVTSGTYTPESQLWRLWRDTHEQAKARFIAIDPASVVNPSSISVTPSEIQSYYDGHKSEFTRPAQAQVQIVALSKAANAADTAAAKQAALDARQRILGGADFATVAKSVSKDPGSAAQGGELGTVTKGQTVPAFEQAVWSLPINEVSEPVQTQFGFHIIQVEDRSADSAKVRHILIPITLSTDHEDKLLTQADSLEKLGEEMSVPEAAKEMGLTARTTTVIKDIPQVPGVGGIQEGVDWIFGDAQPNDVSQVFEGSDAFYMVQLVSRQDAGELTLQEATPTIKAVLVKQKQLAQARDVARQMVDQVHAGKTLDQVAAAHKMQVQEAGPFTRTDYVPGLGHANAAIGTAFGLQPGQTSGVVEADDQLYIIQTVAITPADRKEFEQQKKLLRARVTQSAGEQRWQQFLVALKDNAKIVDNRDKMLHQSGSNTNAPLPQNAGF